jgi:hypothetical protein
MQQQQQQRVPRKTVRLYLDNVVPRTLKLFDESTVVKEEKEIVRIYSIDGIFVIDQKGRFLRQKIVEESLASAEENYIIGDVAFKVDRSEWQSCVNDETIQLQPHHVLSRQHLTKYWLRRDAPTALTIVTQNNVVQDFYFLVAAADLESLREHINADIATFLSMLMLC